MTYSGTYWVINYSLISWKSTSTMSYSFIYNFKFFKFYIWSDFFIHFDNSFHKIKRRKFSAAICLLVIETLFSWITLQIFFLFLSGIDEGTNAINGGASAIDSAAARVQYTATRVQSPIWQSRLPKQQTKLFLHWNISPKLRNRCVGGRAYGAASAGWV
jgi:hypothetical protein